MIKGCMDNVFSLTKNCILVARDYLIIGSTHGSGMMWYLYALLLGCAILYYLLCVKRRSILYVGIVSMIVLSLGYVLEYSRESSLSKLYFIVFGTTRNGIFQGFPFLFIGVMIHRLNLLKWFGKNRLKCWLVLFLILPIASMLHPTKSLFLAPICCLLLVALIMDITIDVKFETKCLRTISVWIYLLHMYVYFIITPFINNNFVIKFLSISSLSICLSILVYLISKRYPVLNSLIK